MQQSASHAAEAPSVVGVVLSWNNYPDVAECLQSLSRSTYPLSAVLVVDNGSTDGTPDRVESGFSAARVIRIPGNVGYARGANRGLLEALALDPDFILFLASDTTISPGMTGALVETAQASPPVGLVGPRVMHYDRPDRMQHGAGFIDAKGWAINRASAETTQCDWITGCGFLVSAAALRALPEPAGFDEAFFAYWEDVDFSHRVAATGFRVLYEPRAQLFHKESADTQATESLTKKRSRQFYMLRNQFLFARRHYPFRRRMQRLARGLILEMPPIVASWIRRQGPGRDALLLVRAYVDGILGRDGRAQYPGLY